MAVALVLPDPRPAPQRRRAVALADAFLAGRKATTQRAYARDLEDFTQFVGADSIDTAAAWLLEQGHGAANGVAIGYRAALLDRGLSPATVNRRLAALRSLVHLARTLGLVPWALEVEGVAGVPYRDTRGPGREGYLRVLAQLAARSDSKGVRDRAIIRLLYDRALRRSEVVSLDLGHADLDAGIVWVLGKGHRERESLTLPPETIAALRAWVAVRGDAPGPLFLNLDRAGKGSASDRRLTDKGVWRLVKAWGERAGLHVRPHGLRHAAITEALDRTNGNIRAAQAFSRHRDPRTVGRYDDNRQDLGGEVARLVAFGS